MAFLSTKLVPTITGCIGTSTPAQDLEFSGLSNFMKIGWRVASFRITVSGAFLQRLPNTYVRTWDDTGSAFTPTLSPPYKMSDLNCNKRLFYDWSAGINFKYTSTDPDDPEGSEIITNGMTINFGNARTNNQTYWFPGSFAGLDIVASNGTGAKAGECFFDGIKISDLYITPGFNTSDYTILRNYRLDFNTTQENIAE